MPNSKLCGTGAIWIFFKKVVFPQLSLDFFFFFFNIRNISCNVPVRVLDCGLLFLPVTQLQNSLPQKPPTWNMMLTTSAYTVLAWNLNFRQKPNEHLTSFCEIQKLWLYILEWHFARLFFIKCKAFTSCACRLILSNSKHQFQFS